MPFRYKHKTIGNSNIQQCRLQFPRQDSYSLAQPASLTPKYYRINPKNRRLPYPGSSEASAEKVTTVPSLVNLRPQIPSVIPRYRLNEGLLLEDPTLRSKCHRYVQLYCKDLKLILHCVLIGFGIMDLQKILHRGYEFNSTKFDFEIPMF